MTDVDRALRNFGDKLTELYHGWPAVVAQVRQHEARINEHEGRITRVEGRVGTLESKIGRTSWRPSPRTTPPPPSNAAELAEAYALKESHTGTYRVTNETFDQIAAQWREIEAERRGVEVFLDRWRRRVLFIIAIIGPIATFIGWALAHFAHW